MKKISLPLALISGLTITGLSNIFISPANAQAVSITVSPMVTIAPIKGAQSRSSFSITNNGQ